VVFRAGSFVFTPPWTALNRWVILDNIVSKKIEGATGLAGRFFVFNKFSIVSTGVRFEFSCRCKFIYPGFRVSKSPRRSFGIQNLYR